MFGYASPIQLFLALVAILLSIMLHELAHGYVALWNGDPTAKLYGRLSLNPLKHFDPVGLVMLIFVRFGYAKPVPINPDNFRRRRWGLFSVSIAGIATNLILAFISVPLWMLCLTLQATWAQFLTGFFAWMIIINVNLALFNLLPIYPLDGYKILESCTRSINPVTRFLRNYGQYILIALIGISILVDFFAMPWWIDIMGMYIGTFRGWIVDGFIKFWSLLF